MIKFRIVILLFLVFVNSCSKEDEINSLNELVDRLQNNIAQLNSEIDDYSNQITPVSYTHLRAHETPEQVVCRGSH